MRFFLIFFFSRKQNRCNISKSRSLSDTPTSKLPGPYCKDHKWEKRGAPSVAHQDTPLHILIKRCWPRRPSEAALALFKKYRADFNAKSARESPADLLKTIDKNWATLSPEQRKEAEKLFDDEDADTKGDDDYVDIEEDDEDW